MFSRVSSQWRGGAGGPIGLDYNVVFSELDREGLEGEVWEEVMAGVRVIEGAALTFLEGVSSAAGCRASNGRCVVRARCWWHYSVTSWRRGRYGWFSLGRW
ncbi:DUF1799 domain-containing protein [Stenotrophomonas sp.]|uniref:DUF1799 domain-containing protein n=1 Tax=Stenotrophomonas sp. TaxID=69392 RepID=UPI0028B22264|nr:DUF1799 domain-containing protein [Stenotrophomonas sp.]